MLPSATGRRHHFVACGRLPLLCAPNYSCPQSISRLLLWIAPTPKRPVACPGLSASTFLRTSQRLGPGAAWAACDGRQNHHPCRRNALRGVTRRYCDPFLRRLRSLVQAPTAKSTNLLPGVSGSGAT